MRRRVFSSLVPGLAALGCAPQRADAPRSPASPPAGAPRGPDDEAWWSQIAGLYPPLDFINLENGFFTRAAAPVMDAHRRARDAINREGARYMRLSLLPALEAVRTRLAALLHTVPEQVALLRNTTEAMNLVLQGLPWQPGDELLGSDQDYPTNVEIEDTLVRRRGVVLRRARVPEAPASDAEVVDAFVRELGPRTRAALVTHVIHLSGQVLPVAAICAALRERGVLAIVDGAHALGQLEVDPAGLSADVYAASLHKWLGAPLGNGVLWLRREHIAAIEPLFADTSKASDDIRRFEHVGTRPAHDVVAVDDAIALHEHIGVAAKRARLLWLRERWVDAVASLPGVRLRCPRAQPRASAIATVAVEGMAPAALAERLWQQHRIYTVAIEHPVIQGVRVSVHPSTPVAHVDAIAQALASSSRRGPGA